MRTVNWLLPDVVDTTELLFDKATCLGIAGRHQASASDSIRTGEIETALQFGYCSFIAQASSHICTVQHC